MERSERIRKVREDARTFFKDTPPSHDWSHVKRVYDLSMEIGKKEGADLEILQLAAYLHDVARRKEDESRGKVDHASEGTKIARKILKKHGYSEKQVRKVLHCIQSHRFRKSKTPKSKEAKVLFDADKLDSIGAIGVARDFAFAGEIGARLYDEDILFKAEVGKTEIYSKSDTAYREFLVKLRKIKEKMLTKTGKEIAEERDAFMRTFFQRLKKEIKGER